MLAGEAMGKMIDAGLLGHFLGELKILHIRMRLASASISWVVVGHTACVDAAAVRAATIFGEVTVRFATHALCENDAVLRPVVRLLTPDARLRDGRVWSMLCLLHLSTELGVGKP